MRPRARPPGWWLFRSPAATASPAAGSPPAPGSPSAPAGACAGTIVLLCDMGICGCLPGCRRNAGSASARGDMRRRRLPSPLSFPRPWSRHVRPYGSDAATHHTPVHTPIRPKAMSSACLSRQPGPRTHTRSCVGSQTWCMSANVFSAGKLCRASICKWKAQTHELTPVRNAAVGFRVLGEWLVRCP